MSVATRTIDPGFTSLGLPAIVSDNVSKLHLPVSKLASTSVTAIASLAPIATHLSLVQWVVLALA